MASLDMNSNAIIQGLARHINCLAETDKMTRRRAIEDIRKETVAKSPALGAVELQSVFRELLKPLLRVLSADPAERCRELAICLLREFTGRVPDPCEPLPYIFPVLAQHLGQKETPEPAEELRLLLIEFLREIIHLSGKKMPPYLDDSVKILQQTIGDPFHEVRKKSCLCASELARAIPEQFHMQSESLIRPLLQSITHQHSRVRTCVVEAIGDVIQYGNGKSVDDVASHLAQRLFDHSPAVRMAVTKVVGNWLLDLLDRYSFHHKLLPLLLTSIADEQPNIRQTADALWHDVGLKYEKENEADLKDKIDFSAGDPVHYPPNVERPNLGCRTLMFRNMSKILPALIRDLSDWVDSTRVKSSALLYLLLLNAEDYITQHMELLLSGVYRACNDENQQVVVNVQKAMTLVGYFVKAEVWLKLILSAVKSAQAPGPLMVLSSVISGAHKSELKNHLMLICGTLLDPDVCHTIQSSILCQLLSCVHSLLVVIGADCQEVSFQLFLLTLTTLALQQNSSLVCQGQQVMSELAAFQGLEDKRELYAHHTKQVLDTFQTTYRSWTIHSYEQRIFETLLSETGPVVEGLLDDIFPIMAANLEVDKDPELRLRVFSFLSRLFVDVIHPDGQQRCSDCSVNIVQMMIIPNCVWRAGRTAAAIRTAAVSCLWALLQSGMLTKEKLLLVSDSLLTQLITTMEDRNLSTRLISCRVMTRVFDTAGRELDQGQLHNMYPELLKRLDDSSDEVRITVSKTFQAYLSCFSRTYDVDLYRVHLEAIYRGLLIHMDDPDAKIQNAILDVLKKAAMIKPKMLLSEVESIKHKHRSPKYCEELVQYISSIQ